MSFQLITPDEKITYKFPEKELKKARERLDREAESRGIGWKKVLALAGELTGHTRGLSISECKLVLEEIKRGRRI